VYREANRVPDAFALMRCRLVDVTLFDDPSDGIDQLCSFDYPGFSCNSLWALAPFLMQKIK
jgi:hypothetical protein